VNITFTIPQKPLGKQRHQTVALLKCACHQKSNGFKGVQCSCRAQFYGDREYCPKCSHAGPYLFVNNIPFTPKEQKEYERLAAMCASQGMRNASPMGKDRFHDSITTDAARLKGPLLVHCDFYFEIPQSRKKSLREGDWHTQRPDLDNCYKSVLDCANQILWADDCVVTAMTAAKRWTKGMPRVEVKVSELQPGERSDQRKTGVEPEAVPERSEGLPPELQAGMEPEDERERRTR
jgi:Endodeoxyribonuclease RusA